MSRIFFAEELETVATFWRVMRRDGVALGFTSHNRDLSFAGLCHRAAPGMLPSAIRRSTDLEPDSVEVQGVLTHDAICQADLRAGRFDGARIVIGIVDWETREASALYHGEIGAIDERANSFEAQLQSAKASLQIDAVPRTSPSCRARFCDPACGLNIMRFTHLATVQAFDPASGKVQFDGMPAVADMLHDEARWLDGPYVGTVMRVIAAEVGGLTLDHSLDAAPAPGDRAFLREGCDHTLATCTGRFGNAINFRGEPFLPGNDLLSRYKTSFS